MHVKRKRSRFTLVELIVSMGILMAICSIVAMASRSFNEGYGRSVKAVKRLKEYMAIDKIMDDSIRNMIPFQWKDANGNSRFVFSGMDHEIWFTALRRAYGKRPGALLFIRLFVEEEQLIAEYQPWPRLPWVEQTDEKLPVPVREVLADKVKEIRFSYAETASADSENAGSVEWLENWAEEEHAALPLAVRLTVEWMDKSSESWLRRVAGVASDGTFGVRSTFDGTTERFSSSLEGEATGGASGQ